MSVDRNNFNRYYTAVRKVWEMPPVRHFSEASATLFLVAFFLLVALKPTIETIFTLNKKITDAKETEIAMTKKIADINTAFAFMQQVESDLPRFEEYFPATPTAKKIVEILSEDIKKTQAANVSFYLGSYRLIAQKPPPAKQNVPSALLVSFDGVNTYPNLLSFLNNLSASKRIFNLKSLNLSREKDGQNLNISVQTNVYYEE